MLHIFYTIKRYTRNLKMCIIKKKQDENVYYLSTTKMHTYKTIYNM